MGTLPYFKFYPGDWLSDRAVRTMSPEARGIFWDLLSVAWQEDGIPADPSSLAGWLGLTPGRFQKVWTEIEGLWEPNGNGNLTNPRLERERSEAIELHRRRVEAGRKGGQSKT